MRWQLALVAGALLVPPARLSAVPVHLVGELAVPAGEPTAVTVRFTATEPGAPDRVLTSTLTVPGESQIDLPAGPMWRAEVEDKGLWSAPGVDAADPAGNRAACTSCWSARKAIAAAGQQQPRPVPFAASAG